MLNDYTVFTWLRQLLFNLQNLALGVIGFKYHFKKPVQLYLSRRLCKLQKGCTRLASASDKVYQLLAQGRWFCSGTPASSTTKTGRHDIAKILLKVALRHQKINQSIMKKT